MGKLPDLALGSYEAAALMGVHFTKPAQMQAKGMIEGRECREIYSKGSPRRFLIYSLASCEENWREYERRAAGRPRTWLDERPRMLKRLAAAQPAIPYSDAIGVGEAAEILGVHPTLVYRMARQKKIVSRSPWNPRRTAPRVLIVSRRSCEQNRRETAAREAAGTKPGRKRKKIA